jgi:hypothetical protein
MKFKIILEDHLEFMPQHIVRRVGGGGWSSHQRRGGSGTLTVKVKL